MRFGVPSSLELFVKNKEAMEKRRKSDQTASLTKKQRKACFPCDRCPIG